MPSSETENTIHTLHVVKESEIDAPIEVVFEATLAELGPEGAMPPDNQPFPMVLEARPGGRWFRDLGNETGHLWGHVQVIKPPKLLEISGPLFMSYPGINFVQYRLTPRGDGTHLKITHRAIGLIPRDDRENVHEGWAFGLKRIAEIAARLKASR